MLISMNWISDFVDLSGIDKIKLINKTTGEKFALSCSFTERQKAILKAGGLLPYTRDN